MRCQTARAASQSLDAEQPGHRLRLSLPGRLLEVAVDATRHVERRVPEMLREPEDRPVCSFAIRATVCRRPQNVRFFPVLVCSQKRVNVMGLRLWRRHSHLHDGGAKHVCHELVEVLLRVKDINTVEPVVSNPHPVEQAALTRMRSARSGV